MTRDELQELLTHGENTWLDWKADFPPTLIHRTDNPIDWLKGKGELLKDLVCIANANDGQPFGYLVYGVKDLRVERQVNGIGKSWDDADFQGWVKETFDPIIDFVYTEVQWSKTQRVGGFKIKRSPLYPHVVIKAIGEKLYEGQVWHRQGTQNTIAYAKELRTMIRGEEPLKFTNPEDPLILQMITDYTEKGEVCISPLYFNKDRSVLDGHRIAYYPNTRKEVWIVTQLEGTPQHIYMLKAK